MNNSEKLDLLLQKFDVVEDRLDGIDAHLKVVDERLEGIEARLDNVEKDITDIKVTIENELRVNIQRIAEGHLDLDRKLTEALRPNQEIEMLSIKVRMMDSDIKEIQKKIS